MLLQQQTICFTGHRDIPLENYAHIKIILVDTVRTAVTAGYKKFIFGGAKGADTMGAEACFVVNQGTPIELELARPWKSHGPSRETIRHARYYGCYDKLIKTNVSDEDVYQIWKYENRNRYMVDNSYIVIALWSEVGHGGTWNCIKYARKMKRAILFINPVTFVQRWEVP